MWKVTKSLQIPQTCLYIFFYLSFTFYLYLVHGGFKVNNEIGLNYYEDLRINLFLTRVEQKRMHTKSRSKDYCKVLI